MRKILIESNATDYCLTVHFLDKDGGTVKKFQFCNYFGQGDNLVRAMAEWVNCGALPLESDRFISI